MKLGISRRHWYPVLAKRVLIKEPCVGLMGQDFDRLEDTFKEYYENSINV